VAKPMTEREIAKALGVSQPAIHKSLARALKKLAKDKKLASALAELKDDNHRMAVQINTANRVIGNRDSR
jgi:predicted DNA-binding protein (UPF0251 family)